MEENKDFEAITLSNVWIKEHILDIIKAINENEIIAETGSSDLFALNQMELVDILRTRIDALKLMRAYILQLKDNVSQYLSRDKKLQIEVSLKGIDDHEELLQNNYNAVGSYDNFYLSDHFNMKLKNLRNVKSLLINACGEAELLMPKRDDETKGKLLEDEDE